MLWCVRWAVATIVAGPIMALRLSFILGRVGVCIAGIAGTIRRFVMYGFYDNQGIVLSPHFEERSDAWEWLAGTSYVFDVWESGDCRLVRLA